MALLNLKQNVKNLRNEILNVLHTFNMHHVKTGVFANLNASIITKQNSYLEGLKYFAVSHPLLDLEKVLRNLYRMKPESQL